MREFLKSLAMSICLFITLTSGVAVAGLLDDLKSELSERPQHIPFAERVYQQLETTREIPSVDWRSIPLEDRDEVYHALDHYISARKQEAYNSKMSLKLDDPSRESMQKDIDFFGRAQDILTDAWSETFMDPETIAYGQKLTKQDN